MDGRYALQYDPRGCKARQGFLGLEYPWVLDPILSAFTIHIQSGPSIARFSSAAPVMLSSRPP